MEDVQLAAQGGGGDEGRGGYVYYALAADAGDDVGEGFGEDGFVLVVEEGV